jgi:hypothetical protein
MKLLSVAEKDAFRRRLSRWCYWRDNPCKPGRADPNCAPCEAADALDLAYARIAQLESEPDEAMVERALTVFLSGPIGGRLRGKNPFSDDVEGMRRAIQSVDDARAARKPADTP